MEKQEYIEAVERQLQYRAKTQLAADIKKVRAAMNTASEFKLGDASEEFWRIYQNLIELQEDGLTFEVRAVQL